MVPLRIRLTMPARRAAAVVLASALACLGLLALGTTQVSWPWFSIWVLLLLTLALAGGSGWLARLGGPGRAGAWLLVLAAGVVMNVHLYWIQLHRQRSERLDVTGVYLQAADGFTLGAGTPALDVRLAGSLAEQDRWAMRIRAEGGRLVADSLDGIDWVERRHGGHWARLARARRFVTGARAWVPLWGEELGRERREVTVRDSAGATHRLRLRGDGTRGILEWDGRPVPLAAESPVLDRRLARRLRAGITLDELPWRGPVPAAARHLAVTLVEAPIASPFGLLRWPRLRVAARGAGVAVLGARAPRVEFDGDDTVRVGSRGRVWAFTARLAPPSRWRAPDVVQVGFVQRPGSRGWPLPASDECVSDAACGVISSHPLPPPIAYFDLGGFGLDTARYALLGRLDRQAGADSIRLVTDTSSRRVPFGEVEPVEARRLRADVAPAGWLLRVHRPEASDWASLAWTLLALAGFLALCARALRASPLAGAWLRAENAHATAAWLVANLVTAFLSVRLLLGLRVTYAAPFYERGAATAVGLWLVVGTLAVALAWWPVLWTSALRGLRLLRRRGEGPVLTGVVAARPLPPAREALRALLPPLALAALLVLTTLRAEDALGAALSVALVLFAWMAVAVSEIASAPEWLGDDPVAMLTAETTAPEDLRATLGITAALGLGVAVASRAPLVSLGVVLVGTVVALVWKAGRRVAARRQPSIALAVVPRAPRAPVRRALRWGAVLVTLVSLVRVADLLQGPTLLFGIIVMLFLLAVRAGVLCLRRLDARSATAEGRAARVRGRLALLSALMLPVGALALAGLFDVGLALVVFVPLFATVVLAAGGERMGRGLLAGAGALFAVAVWAATSVLFPDTARLEREGRSDIERGAVLFAELGGPVARLADLAEPTRVAVRRALVRGLAARRPELLEQLLPAVGPSEARDEIVPSLEQAWGGRAYAAAGWTGAGFARTAALGRGVSAATAYAENTFSVFVLSEHGAVGGLAVLALYAALAGVGVWWAVRARRLPHASSARAASLAIVVGGTLLLVLPAAYVALSNLGVVPLTGQNMPFLGLNAWSDVVLVSAVTTAMLAALSGLAASEAA